MRRVEVACPHCEEPTGVTEAEGTSFLALDVDADALGARLKHIVITEVISYFECPACHRDFPAAFARVTEDDE